MFAEATVLANAWKLISEFLEPDVCKPWYSLLPGQQTCVTQFFRRLRIQWLKEAGDILQSRSYSSGNRSLTYTKRTGIAVLFAKINK